MIAGTSVLDRVARRLRAGPALVLVLSWGFFGLATPGRAAVLADSVADWQAAAANDGVVDQNEFGWQYGYISNFLGNEGIFFGWHQSPFYWEASSGINIFWPPGQRPPDIVWGQGGDSTGCRPAMVWVDGGYPWSGNATDRWAAVKRWTSDYTGKVQISGEIGRYFDRSVVTGWDIEFQVAVNANMLGSPTVYRRTIAWDDTARYSYSIDKIPVKAGDTVNFLIIPLDWNAANSQMRMTAAIAETSGEPLGDLDIDNTVILTDFSLLAAQWGRMDCSAPAWCGGADFDHSGSVDAADLALFAAHWLETTPAN